MKIHNLESTRIVLVRFDEIPLNRLIHHRYLEELTKLFEFSQVEITQDNTGNAVILCLHGIHKNDIDTYIIKRLEIQERKIVLKMDGSSEEADESLAKLIAFLANLAERTDEEYLQPILISHESEIVAYLEFGVEALFSPVYMQFINSQVARKVSSDIAGASVKPLSLSFIVEYQAKDESLNDYRITLSRKEFIVGPRIGTPLTDRVYYSKAPVDTNTHIELLEKLEKTILQLKD